MPDSIGMWRVREEGLKLSLQLVDVAGLLEGDSVQLLHARIVLLLTLGAFVNHRCLRLLESRVLLTQIAVHPALLGGHAPKDGQERLDAGLRVVGDDQHLWLRRADSRPRIHVGQIHGLGCVRLVRAVEGLRCGVNDCRGRVPRACRHASIRLACAEGGGVGRGLSGVQGCTRSGSLQEALAIPPW